MAKTKRSKKTKQEEISEELKTRIISAVALFLVVVAAMKLGPIGDGLHYVFSYLFGNFVGIIYILFIIVCGYIIYRAKLPRYSSPRAVGLYMMMIAILVFMQVNDDGNVGMKVINLYMRSVPLNRGGFIGACLYGLLSGLFDYEGAVIAAVFIFAIGLTLLGSQFYLKHKKDFQRKKKKKIKEEETHTSRFIDFFANKKDNKQTFFPDEVFEDTPKSKDIDIEQYQKEDDLSPTAFQYNDDSMTLEIKDKETDELQDRSQESFFHEEKNTISRSNNKKYRLPPLSLLKTLPNKKNGDNRSYAVDNAEKLTSVLRQFGVNATITNIFIGPTVTKYELKLEIGTRVNKIMQLQDDIKLALAAKDIRIEAPIPGKPAVGVEIPNQVASMVSFKEGFKDIPKDIKDNPLLVPLGKDVSGQAMYAQLNKMPHLLIAGATGSGKSVCVNTIICSILMRAKPDEVKLILIDPKKVELSNYNGIPHLLAPVVTDPKKAAATLREVVGEMERRYDLFAKANVRKIEAYNKYVDKKNSEDEEQIEKLPFIVVILDEVADLMMVASKDVEDCIMRIAQLARAAGIHLIVATQRPSTDIITGVIKANIPSRIAFAVSSSIDSRTILDCSGAEKLLGKGDMLFSPMGSTSPIRVQGAFVTDEEVEAITYYTMSQQEVEYDEKYVNVKPNMSSLSSKEEEEDEEYEMCRAFVIKAQKASTSLLQRQFRIGYNKAARIIDQLEADGVIGPQLGSKPREVYIRGYEEEE